MSYGAAKKRPESYTKIVKELPEMLRDTMEQLTKAVRGEANVVRLGYNCTEGNTPKQHKAYGLRSNPRRREPCLLQLWLGLPTESGLDNPLLVY
jgi:hypothetical protein